MKKKKYGNILVRLLLWFYRTVYKPKVHYQDGAEEPLSAPPAIYIANHTSLNDAMFLVAAMGNDATILVAKDWYEKKQYNGIMKSYGCIPCDRYGLDTNWLRDGIRILKEGRSVLIFPEGKTRQDGQLNEFKSGFAMLAAMSGAPIVSVGLSGCYHFGRATHYVVDAPAQLDRSKGMQAEYLQAQCNEYQQRIAGLREIALGKTPEKLRTFKR